jgi:shikimate kinase
MGAGKSTVARLFAEETGWPLIDLDRRIEKKEGEKIKDIFADRGEEYFREIETEYLQDISHNTPPLVVACGGGVPLRAVNRDIMTESGLPVYLHVSAETALERIGSDPRRPLLASKMQEVKLLWKNRQKKYNKIPWRLNTEEYSPDQLVGELKKIVSEKSEIVFE